ncbi:DNA-binding NarL/FixJ family response regulator [Nonomuraea thailandensis]|uniref:DNA-binding NarL/FixJ family response regulator n=1 Tax=Nonomuraea thailandensis TaxID=1188745 RepID=A0A9X2GLB4_9ACTN|nr:hypothetical protein [Nonomuraea thailandensis]MCP2359772.1 DNA-binding NarL/FixJ family response regulator [Nonomuraea thailandensis]
MSNTATEVITDALTSAAPNATDILDALGNAGYRVIRPESAPAWIPVTPRSLAKAQRVAELINTGKTLQQIAAETRMSLRQVERYSAAAREMGLTERRR